MKAYKRFNTRLMIATLGVLFSLHVVRASPTDSTTVGTKKSSSKSSVGVVFEKVDEEEIYDPFIRIYLGGFHAFTKTSITINSNTLGTGTTIDPEDRLGHSDRKILPRLELLINPGKRHEISFTYWTIRRNRTHVLEEDIQFEDTTFYINSSLTSKFNFSNYSGSYRFSILATDHVKAGVSLGGKFFDSHNSIRANLNGHSYTAEKRIYAPIPLAGLHATVNSGKHLLFRGTAEYFKLGIKDWDFHTLDLRGGIEYYFFKHIGIGADYHYFDTLIRKVPSGKLNGEIDLKFHAISVYLAIRL